jgi:subtilisin family serine protease
MRTPISGRALLAAALMLIAVLVALPAAYGADKSSVRVIVGFKNAPGASERAAVASAGGQVVRQYSLIPAVVADIPANAVKKLQSDASVSFVEEEQHRVPTGHIIPGQIWPGTPEILPWGVDRIDADEVWDPDGDLAVNAGAVAGQGTTVAVLDTGVETTHPDLAANLDLADSFDFVDNDANVSDVPGPTTGHGTSTSGIVAAVDNAIGVIGVAPRTKVVMYRVCDSSVLPDGDCPEGAIVAGLQEAVNDGADVVSMSFGGIGFSQAEKQAIKAVSDAGIVLVASAGNTPSPVAGARTYPSGFSEVISVGAIDEDDNLADFSTFGGKVDVVAPGVETPTTTLLGFGREVLLRQNAPASGLIDANPMQFSGVTPPSGITANLVFAGLGQPADFAAISCTGRIALMSRGTITFQAKVENATAAGCLGAIIYNNVPGNFNGTLTVPQTLPAVSLSQEDGLVLKASLDAGQTVNVTLTVIAIDYDTFSGTSASAPHVAGVAALVLDADSSLSTDEVTRILERTAENLGNPSQDIHFGWGIVDAEAAVACATGQGPCT